MINQPKYGTDEYYQWKADEVKDQVRDFELQKEAVEVQNSHQLEMKKLELEVKRVEVSLTAVLRVLVYVPIVLIAILPIMILGLFRRKIPIQLLKLLELNHERLPNVQDKQQPVRNVPQHVPQERS